VAKNTSTRGNGGDSAGRRSGGGGSIAQRKSGGVDASTRGKSKSSSAKAAEPDARQARDEATRLLREAGQARAQAASALAEAEERARGLLMDARATAEGVRAEGMEIVSELRQMGDALRGNAERLLRDIQAIHSRMLSRLDEVEAELDAGSDSGAGSAQTAPGAEGASPESTSEADELEVPDFVSPG
jgi:hypothetical protein